MENAELKLKIHFKLFFKTLSKIYAKFSISEPKIYIYIYIYKNDRVMRNSDFTLKILFKVFSYHNVPEVE